MTNKLENITTNWELDWAKNKLSRAKYELKENLRNIVLYGALTAGCFGFTGYNIYKAETNPEYKQIKIEQTELNKKINEIENTNIQYLQANDTSNYLKNLNKNTINKEKLKQLGIKANKYSIRTVLSTLFGVFSIFGLAPFLTELSMRDIYKDKYEEAERELNDKQN